MRTFLRNNALSIVFFALFTVTIGAQAITGWHTHNEDRMEEGQGPLNFEAYLVSGHFVQATFENWESEFLQMFLFVVLTVSLRQKGSSESKSFEPEEVDREPDPGKKDAPWPVRKGGIWLKFYKYSLSIALAILFLISIVLHFYGSFTDENDKLLALNKPLVSFSEFIGQSRFWFESFQNWQSEFLSVFAIVVLSVYLRQKGSPQSKPVDAPHSETGE